MTEGVIDAVTGLVTCLAKEPWKMACGAEGVRAAGYHAEAGR